MNNSFDNYSSAASAQSTPESKPQINTKSFAYIPLSPINKIFNSKFDSAHDIFFTIEYNRSCRYYPNE